MRIGEGTIRGFPLIVIEGELEHSTKLAVRDAVDEVFSGSHPPRCLVFDLTACVYIDSGGVGVFLSALGQLPASGWLGLIGASVGIKRVLKYAGLLDVDRVRLFTSPRDAAAALDQERDGLQTPGRSGRKADRDNG